MTIQSAIASATLYGIYKYETFLARNPQRSLANENWSKIVQLTKSLHTATVNRVGKQAWDLNSEIILSNSWISALVIGALFKKSNPNIPAKSAPFLLGAFLLMSSATWLSRLYLVRGIKNVSEPLARFIATPTVELEEIEFSKTEEQIPKEHENDPTLNETICPISQSPVRSPLLDPTNEITVYNKEEILRWLEKNPVSPITNKPLIAGDLIPCEQLRRKIETHLETLKQ